MRIFIAILIILSSNLVYSQYSKINFQLSSNPVLENRIIYEGEYSYVIDIKNEISFGIGFSNFSIPSLLLTARYYRYSFGYKRRIYNGRLSQLYTGFYLTQELFLPPPQLKQLQNPGFTVPIEFRINIAPKIYVNSSVSYGSFFVKDYILFTKKNSVPFQLGVGLSYQLHK